MMKTQKITAVFVVLMLVSLWMGNLSVFAQEENPWGDGQVIVYTSDRNGNSDLFMMTIDGSYEIRLTYDNSNAYFPAISPLHGASVAFHSDRSGTWQIYILSLISGDVFQVADDGENYYPAWSPNGSQLVFSHYDGVSYQLYIADLATETIEIHQLTDTRHDNFRPYWSPDGTQIIMNESYGAGELWLVDAITGEVQHLTDNDIWEISPEISPDGRYVVYSAGRSGNNEIFVMDFDTGDTIQLTENSDDDSEPTWSPDGKYIIFGSDRDGTENLYIMTRNGENVRQLTVGEDVNTAPSTGILGYWILAETFMP